MSTKNSKALMVAPSEEQLAVLKNEFPAEQGFTRTLLPRLGMYSQDKMEGKGKNMKVVAEAGTFFTDKPGEEEGEDGKKKWEKDEIGTEIEGIIIFQRKQLSFYNESTEEYTSSPIYDDENEEIPLFLNKKEIDRGTPAELKKRKEYLETKNGKTTSNLKDNRILYVLYEGELYQMNLHGSSMYSFMRYARSTTVPAYVTKMSSEEMEKGDINWNQMSFEQGRALSKEEVSEVISKIKDIKNGIAQEKAYYAASNEANKKAEDDLEKF